MLQVILTKAARAIGFLRIILDLKTSKDLLPFMALGTKDHILGAKQDIVFVPYLTILGFLL